MRMEPELDYHTAKVLLEWQLEAGVSETICEAAVNRYETAPAPQPDVAGIRAGSEPGPGTPPPPADAGPDPVESARAAAMRAADLGALAQVQAEFDHCELKKGARNFVFADGQPGSRVMIIGEAPGRDEDLEGRPFVGRAGQLLDRMFAALGMARDGDPGLYIVNILPWRPPHNRDPLPEEIAMMMPFVEKHVALAAPDVLVLMGNIACQAMLGRKGITRLRGTWTEALGRPALPMFHPAYLLRNPAAKREAWADLLALQAKLRETE